MFDIVAATSMGDIYHGYLENSADLLETCDLKLKKVLDGQVLGHRRVLDLKVVRNVSRDDSIQPLLLATTPDMLFQFTEQGIIETVFERYAGRTGKKIAEKHAI